MSGSKYCPSNETLIPKYKSENSTFAALDKTVSNAL